MLEYVEFLGCSSTSPASNVDPKLRISAKFARCTNASCKMLQNLDMAKATFSAILIITSPDITEIEVHAFEKELRKITGIDSDKVDEIDLLEASPFSCCTNAKSVVTSVWHPLK